MLFMDVVCCAVAMRCRFLSVVYVARHSVCFVSISYPSGNNMITQTKRKIGAHSKGDSVLSQRVMDMPIHHRKDSIGVLPAADTAYVASFGRMRTNFISQCHALACRRLRQLGVGTCVADASCPHGAHRRLTSIYS